MKKQSGFTLIELVIVIIILGILAATAVPKFVDLQGDARASAMKGVKGALEGAATLTYSRSAIDGTEKDATGVANDIPTVFGYPQSTLVALEDAAGLSDTDWTIVGTSNSGVGTPGIAYITEAGALSGSTSTCVVKYVEAADNSSRPEITTLVTGC